MAEDGEAKIGLIFFTTASQLDLAQIDTYNVAAYGEVHAENYMNFLFSCLDLVSDFPGVGTPVPQRLGVRSYIAKRRPSASAHGHRNVYQVTTDGIEVIRILHTRIDVSAAWS